MYYLENINLCMADVRVFDSFNSISTTSSRRNSDMVNLCVSEIRLRIRLNPVSAFSGGTILRFKMGTTFMSIAHNFGFSVLCRNIYRVKTTKWAQTKNCYVYQENN